MNNNNTLKYASWKSDPSQAYDFNLKEHTMNRKIVFCFECKTGMTYKWFGAHYQKQHNNNNSNNEDKDMTPSEHESDNDVIMEMETEYFLGLTQ